MKPVLSGNENSNYSLIKNYDELLNSINKKTKIPYFNGKKNKQFSSPVIFSEQNIIIDEENENLDEGNIEESKEKYKKIFPKKNNTEKNLDALNGNGHNNNNKDTAKNTFTQIKNKQI